MSNIGQAMLEAANLIRTTQGYLGQKDAEDIVGLMTSDRSLAVDSTDSSSDLGGFVEEDGKRVSTNVPYVHKHSIRY